ALISNFIKKQEPDLPHNPGYRLLCHQVQAQKSRKTSKGMEMVITSNKGSLALDVPTPVAEFFIQHSEELDISSTEPVWLDKTMQSLSEKTGMAPELLVKQDWWKKLRKDFLWVIKG
ncbi:MAG: hypothetical protein K2Q22_18170, partial [Cytophagales bacterium]|nr:hypothetical protein [Cytophagales bacterium]